MPAEKTSAVVLRVIPYRESSCILHLFSREHGLVQGIAKGVRRARAGGLFPERGMLVDAVVYLRHNRDLQTIGGLEVAEFYPSIRAQLHKAALRDAAFELTLKTIRHSDYHPELYDLFVRLLRNLDIQDIRRCFPYVLWGFFLSYAALLGFALDLVRCIDCGRSVEEGVISAQHGGIRCETCAPAFDPERHIPGNALSFLKNPDADPPSDLPPAELARITRLLASYCAWHFDIGVDFNSLDFVDELLRGAEGRVTGPPR
jgi:DNA repair protein RecO (recombination protein O)